MVLKRVILGLVFVFFLFTFAIIKFPDPKIKSWIRSQVQSELGKMGYTLQADSSRISFGWGVTYTLEQVKLFTQDSPDPVILDRLDVSPNLLPMILKKMGAHVKATLGDGSLSLDGSLDGTKTNVDFTAKDFDLSKSGALGALASLKGGAILNGSGEISMDVAGLPTATGKAKLQLKKIKIDSQTLGFISLPELLISEGIVDVNLDRGKVLIQTLKLGKAAPSVSPSDDIGAVATGDLQLGRAIELSQLNLKTQFSFSEKIKKAFGLLDALLAVGKKPDGSFSCKFQGPINGTSCAPN